MVAKSVLMIKPVAFGFNPQTAITNTFQHNDGKNVNDLALLEFDNFVNILRSKNIPVEVFEDTLEPHTPDSIFPNNWFSTFEGLRLYPMLNQNRRDERKPAVMNFLANKYSLAQDLRYFEDQDLALEGTGSLVFDYQNKIAYCCVGPRANLQVLQKLDYQQELFGAFAGGKPIYHTNVMMAIGRSWAVICKAVCDRELVFKDRAIVEISENQMNHFCGNILEIQNTFGQTFIVMSQSAFDNFTGEQLDILSQFGELLVVKIDTIEKYGGGSARCMMAELF